MPKISPHSLRVVRAPMQDESPIESTTGVADVQPAFDFTSMRVSSAASSTGSAKAGDETNVQAASVASATTAPGAQYFAASWLIAVLVGVLPLFWAHEDVWFWPTLVVVV